MLTKPVSCTSNRYRTCFVVYPAYNEEKSIRRVLRDTADTFRAAGRPDPHLIVVDDGSADRTAEEVAPAAPPPLRPLPESDDPGTGIRTSISLGI